MKKLLLVLSFMLTIPFTINAKSVTEQITNNGQVQGNINSTTVKNTYAVYQKWREDQDRSPNTLEQANEETTE